MKIITEKNHVKLADIVDELFAERYFDRVDQSDFFVDDQV